MATFDLNAPYHRDQYLAFLRNEFMPEDFRQEEKIPRYTKEYKYIKDAVILGESPAIGMKVYEITHPSAHDPRVSLTRETFHLMRAYNDFNALAIYTTPAADNYRLSYVTIGAFLEDKKVKYEYSNPRRYSYFLGPGAKINTPNRYLIQKGRIKGTADFQERFSVEVVNKEFYQGIAALFTQLVEGKLKLPTTNDHKKKQEFAVRMIGRVVFCWFLKKKSTLRGGPLIPEEILSLDAVEKNENYYHTILEKLFFQVLNTPQEKRRDEFKTGPFAEIPFLNGGLFEPHNDDNYEVEKFTGLSHINDLKVPDEWMEGFFKLLELYNFTIDENTSMDVELSVDPEMLGRIFENLLAEINPETGETARKSTGSYYTPRPIVEYMVDESLKQYLETQTGIHEKKLELLLSYSRELEEVEEAERPTLEEGRAIIDALDQVKIIDPACGSGAYPMGALQKLVLILEKIDPNSEQWLDKSLEKVPYELQQIARQSLQKENVDYIRKMGLIRSAIYGVDNQQIAVEISRLRVFLSLIVDTTIDEKKVNLGIPPLPNLEFKFVCADTLIGLPREGKDTQKGLFEDRGNIKKLKELRDRYFESYGDKKEKIKEEFKQTQDRMWEQMKTHRFQGNMTLYLASWEPFSDKSSEWFEPDWMFGIKDGFDIVIGNPPYVQVQNFSGKKQQEYWEKQEYETYVKTGDVYCLFYERGYRVLKEGGVLAFITSNKWMRAKYGTALRTFFSEKTGLMVLIDFGGFQVFQSATVDTSILVFRKGGDNSHFMKACTIREDFKKTMNIDEYVSNHSIEIRNLSGQSWIILTEEEYAVKKRIEEIGTPLKDWDITINYGIKTGLNEAFIVDGKKKDELIAKDPKSGEILKPILRGRDIKRYKAEYADLWMISTFPALEIDIDDYPAVKSYLQSFGKKLEQSGEDGSRKKTNNKWFEVQDTIAYYNEFDREKIVYPDIMRLPRAASSFEDFPYFYLDKNGYYIDVTNFFMTGAGISLIISVLSSRLGVYAFTKFYSGPQFDEKGFRYKKEYLQNFPVPKLPPEKQLPFEILVDCNHFAKEKGMEEESILLESVIDGMVYDLYFPGEMKKARCYITGLMTEILRPFKKDDTESFKSEYIRTLNEFCKKDKIISHSLIHRRTVKPVQVITGEKEGKTGDRQVLWF